DRLAVVAANLPPHEGVVKGGFLLEVADLEGEMIQQDRLPSGWLEWRRHRRGVAARRPFRFRAAATALAEGSYRRHYGGESKRLQQIASRDLIAIELIGQFG